METKTADRQSPLVYLFARTWKYAQNRMTIVKYWAMFLAATCLSMFVTPFVWAKIMGTITEEGITRDNILRLCLLLLANPLANSLFWSFHGPARVIERMNAFWCRANYRKTLMRGIFGLPMEWHVDHHSGDTIDKIEKGTSGIFDFSQQSFEIIYAVTKLVGSVCVLGYFCPQSIPIVLAMLAVSVLITMGFDKKLLEEYKELSRSENEIAESVYDGVSNISTVITLRVEHHVFSAIEQQVMKPLGLFSRNIKKSELKWCLVSMCCATITTLVLAMYFWTHIGQPKSVIIANVYLLMQYLDKVCDVFYQFTEMYSDTLKRQARVMNCELLSDDFTNKSLADHVLPQDWGKLEIRGLNFSYEKVEGKRIHLDDISLDINRGEKIAFVGPVGSGKTTLLKVIRDLHHPQSVSLSVDGTKIDEGFAGICRDIALIPQHPEIFARTIRDNITLGAIHADEEIDRVCRIACFSEVVKRLPKGYQSSLKEKGVNLSGGERQCLALARGLLAAQDKDILLLDEPTSSTDASKEISIYTQVFQEFDGVTVIAALHGLHLLPLFDRICVFKDGKIVGDGTLEELLVTCPDFVGMWKRRKEIEKSGSELAFA